MILIATKTGMCHLFGFKDKIFKIQNIQAAHISDAIFFKNRANLYLAIANNEGDSLSRTRYWFIA